MKVHLPHLTVVCYDTMTDLKEKTAATAGNNTYFKPNFPNESLDSMIAMNNNKLLGLQVTCQNLIA